MLLANKVPLERRIMIALSFLIVSFLLVVLGFDKIISGYLVGLGLLGALIAGAFYTLGTTTPFAIVVILELMKVENPLTVAFVASLGATVVDCVMFVVFRDALERSSKKILARLRSRSRKFSVAFPFLGFFMFGLPIPDELGMALMEITTIDVVKLGMIIFFAKFVTLVLFRAALFGG